MLQLLILYLTFPDGQDLRLGHTIISYPIQNGKPGINYHYYTSHFGIPVNMVCHEKHQILFYLNTNNNSPFSFVL